MIWVRFWVMFTSWVWRKYQCQLDIGGNEETGLLEYLSFCAGVGDTKVRVFLGHDGTREGEIMNTMAEDIPGTIEVPVGQPLTLRARDGFSRSFERTVVFVDRG